MISHVQEVLLNSVSAALSDKPFDDPMLKPNEWLQLFHLADEQEILPLVYDRVFSCLSLKDIEGRNRDKADAFRERAISAAVRQIVQTNEFLTLLLHIQDVGLNPIVLKGIICRNLYPSTMLRPSIDEDLLILPDELETYHSVFLKEDLFCDQDLSDVLARENSIEVSYHKDNSPTYIEIHTSLFNPASKVFGEINRLFSDIKDEMIQIEDVTVRTLAPTEHLLYLILHMYKHFVYSGVGIRPLCDIGLFAEHFADMIDWDLLKRSLEQVGVLYYARALFHIINLYLLPDAIFFSLIQNWKIDKVEVQSLLEDIFASGLHGDSSMMRLHSSNITLQTIETALSKPSSTHRRCSGHSILTSVFPSLKSMRGRYPYLKKAPFLLPVAWVQRIAHYLKETRGSSEGGAISESAASIRLGKERVELLKKYHII